MLDDEGVDGSQVTQNDRDRRGTSNIFKEWEKGNLRSLVDMCEEKYWKDSTSSSSNK